MPKNQSYHKRDHDSTDLVTNVKDGWMKVLADAEHGLAEAQTRVRRLKRAIRTLRTKIKAGEPWPGTSTQT
jgi:hypothetical protein